MDAVLPLVGVVIGAVIGAAMTLLLDRRREKRAEKAALRVVLVELQEIQGRWSILMDEWKKAETAETAEWVASEVKHHPFVTTEWKQQQGLLAASLSSKDWTDLVGTYRVVNKANEVAQLSKAEVELAKQMNLAESRWPIDLRTSHAS